MCSKGKILESPSKFDERFIRLLEKENDIIISDCEFNVEGAFIKGHRLLFSMASEVFKAMFYGSFKEDRVVTVEDVSLDGFEGMKEFIYIGEVSFKSVFHALSVFIAARKYLISALSQKCMSFIFKKGILPSEVLEFFDYCNMSKVTEFENLCCKVIQNSTDEAIKSDYFELSSPETVEFILKSSTLKLSSEIEVFDLFERWALAESQRRGTMAEHMEYEFANMKRHIRLLTISSKDFVSRVDKSYLLTKEEKHAIALNLLELNSQPMPESLSSKKMRRNFTSLLKQDIDGHMMTLVVPLMEPYKRRGEEIIHINSFISVKIHHSRFMEYICFHIQALKKVIKNITYLITIKGKLEVVPETNACKEYVNRHGPVLIENECSILVDCKTTVKETMIFAKIPIEKLRNNSFLNDGMSAVIIKGRFKVSSRRSGLRAYSHIK